MDVPFVAPEMVVLLVIAGNDAVSLIVVLAGITILASPLPIAERNSASLVTVPACALTTTPAVKVTPVNKDRSPFQEVLLFVT